MPSQVKLVYNLNVGLQSAAPGSKVFNRVAQIDWDPNADVASMIGMTLSGLAQTAPGPSTIRIEMDYALEAQALVSFPTDDLIRKATRNLFGGIFESQVPALVTAEEPVVS